MAADKSAKRILRPFRTAIGRFPISPLQSRVEHLERMVTELQLRNTLIHKAATFIAADKVKGDYLEFGVYTGGSFFTAITALREAFRDAYTPGPWNTARDCTERKALWDKMRFFAFDSFEGLPEARGVDELSEDFVGGKFACSEENFRNNLSSRGLSLDKVITVPGWFENTVNADTWKKHKIESAAIVHIDSDYYESAKTILSAIAPILVTGTVIIFDDWYNYKGDPDLGEQRAFREWREEHPELTLTPYQKEGAWRNSFIVRVSSEPRGAA